MVFCRRERFLKVPLQMLGRCTPSRLLKDPVIRNSGAILKFGDRSGKIFMIKDKDTPVRPPEYEKEEPPPFWSSWNKLYGTIIVYTVILVLALYLMTITLNR